MSTVLFDTPGPQALKRYRTISLVGTAVVLLLVAGFIWRMGAYGELAYSQWEVFLTPSFVVALLKGMLATVVAAVVAILLAAVFAVIFGLGKLSEHAWIRWPSWVVVEFFRAIPVLLLIFFIFITYGSGDGGIGRFWSLVLALMLYNGSVLAEILRAGVEAVPKGQSEAGYAIGMRKVLLMRQVLLPQAVKIMLPALISQFVVTLKDTSLGYAIGAPSFTQTGKQIYTQFSNQLPTALVLAAGYIILNVLLTKLATWAQRKFVGEQEQLAVNTGGA